jgi:hypothetical protein
VPACVVVAQGRTAASLCVPAWGWVCTNKCGGARAPGGWQQAPQAGCGRLRRRPPLHLGPRRQVQPDRQQGGGRGEGGAVGLQVVGTAGAVPGPKPVLPVVKVAACSLIVLKGGKGGGGGGGGGYTAGLRIVHGGLGGEWRPPHNTAGCAWWLKKACREQAEATLQDRPRPGTTLEPPPGWPAAACRCARCPSPRITLSPFLKSAPKSSVSSCASRSTGPEAWGGGGGVLVRC